MSKALSGKKIIIFTCNWHAYSSFESAGIDRLPIKSVVYPIRLACLGRITPGIILKTFEGGADGILLMGCPEGECRHNGGNKAAREVFLEARSLLRMLGYQENQLRYALLEAEDGKSFMKELNLLFALEEEVKS
jgi:F420-non-reducing hydrogenase iron-sulfur subunit